MRATTESVPNVSSGGVDNPALTGITDNRPVSIAASPVQYPRDFQLITSTFLEAARAVGGRTDVDPAALDAGLKAVVGLCGGSGAPATSPLTFEVFQRLNALRSKTAFGKECGHWTLNDWAVALAGEVGELCNLLKKNRRGLATDERFALNGPFHEFALHNLLSELADVMIYADLMITELGADTAVVVLEKFNEVSRRVGFQASEVDHFASPLTSDDHRFVEPYSVVYEDESR
jgi:NTP pyrophosphatase (non-canonical NTP hydrolase)